MHSFSHFQNKSTPKRPRSTFSGLTIRRPSAVTGAGSLPYTPCKHDVYMEELPPMPIQRDHDNSDSDGFADVTQEAMDEWLNSDTTPNKKNRQNKDNNSTRNATDQESDDSTDTADEPVHQTTQDPTSESQRPYFRNINRLPKIHQERQRRHFQFLSAQPKPYQPKQQVPRTTFTQRQLSGWLL